MLLFVKVPLLMKAKWTWLVDVNVALQCELEFGGHLNIVLDELKERCTKANQVLHLEVVLMLIQMRKLLKLL